MKLLLGADVYGWRMTGLLGEGGTWFLGHSRRLLNTATLALSDTPAGGLQICLDAPTQGRAANIARDLMTWFTKIAKEEKEPK